MSARRIIALAALAMGLIAPSRALAAPHWQDSFAASGIQGGVFDTMTLRDTLYVAGSFDRIGDQVTGQVAAFDGTRWSGVLPALGETVSALGTWRGAVVAATHHDDIFESAAYSRVWLRTGSGWTPLGDSVRGEITHIVAYHDSVIVAGRFTSRDHGHTTLALHTWDGSHWRADADTLAGTIDAVAVYHDELYIGGAFRRPSGARFGAARRSATGWIGEPVAVAARAFAVAQGRLWMLAEVGLDDRVFAHPASTLASFDGTAWRDEPGETIRGVSFPSYAEGGLCAVGDSVFVATASGIVLRLPSGAWRSLYASSPFFTHQDTQLAWLRGSLYVGPVDTRDARAPLARLATVDGVATLQPLATVSAIAHLGQIAGLAVHDGLLYIEPNWDDAVVFDGRASRLLGGGQLSTRYFSGRGNVCEVGGELYAAVDWTSELFGQTSAVGRWTPGTGSGDDPQWRPVPAPGIGLPLDGYVDDFAEWDGSLIAGGDFLLGPVAPANVARLDAGGWHALGHGFDEEVYALCVYHGALYAGGRFTAAGDEACSHIARWDGLAWREVGGGIDGDVEVMRVYGDRLIVGGRFTHAGGAEASSIVAWDGAQWATLGGGTISGRVWSLTEYRGDLIAGGSMLLTTPRDATFGIGRWHDGAWASMDGGLDGSVYALAVYGSALYAGGEFKNSLGFYTGVLRVWDDDAARSVDGFAPSLQAAGGGSLSAPLQLAYFLPRPAHATLAVFDARGRRIATLEDGMRDTGQHTVVWDPRATLGGVPASGVYTIALDAGGRRAARRVVWMR